MTESAFLRRLKLCCEAFGGRRKRARICRNVGPFGGPKGVEKTPVDAISARPGEKKGRCAALSVVFRTGLQGPSVPSAPEA